MNSHVPSLNVSRLEISHSGMQEIDLNQVRSLTFESEALQLVKDARQNNERKNRVFT